jgi:hypothetical protein
MKNYFVYFFLLFLFLSLKAYSQEKKESEWGVSFSGFVRYDLFYDTRQVETLREGSVPFYPKNEILDKNGKDINDQSNLNMLLVNSRLTTIIKGPDAFGAKSSGIMEGEYFGGSDADINGFRLRHAYLKLDWEKTSLLIGQYWHPMFVTDVIPTANFAAPIIPYSRNPQIRFTQSFNEFNFIATAYTQRDFRHLGPDGMVTNYLRNASIPDLNFQFNWKNTGNIAGIGFDYKTLVPRIKSISGLKTNESIGSYAINGYMKFDLNPFTFKLQGVYGQNMTDISALGGYAAKAADSNTYTNDNTFSAWTELCYGKDFQINLFIGYTKNLGFDDNINPNYVYARAPEIDNLLKIAPNITVISGKKTKLIGEVEYSSAAFGTIDSHDKGKVINTKNIDNIRITFSAIYYF